MSKWFIPYICLKSPLLGMSSQVLRYSCLWLYMLKIILMFHILKAEFDSNFLVGNAQKLI